MNIPGFNAEASLYTTSRQYCMQLSVQRGCLRLSWHSNCAGI